MKLKQKAFSTLRIGCKAKSEKIGSPNCDSNT